MWDDSQSAVYTQSGQSYKTNISVSNLNNFETIHFSSGHKKNECGEPWQALAREQSGNAERSTGAK